MHVAPVIRSSTFFVFRVSSAQIAQNVHSALRSTAIRLLFYLFLLLKSQKNTHPALRATAVACVVVVHLPQAQQSASGGAVTVPLLYLDLNSDLLHKKTILL